MEILTSYIVHFILIQMKILLSFFENQGIKLKAESGGRIFPVSDKSSDIIKGLSNELKNS